MDRIKNFLFKNTSTKQTVAKNTFWLFFGEILGRLLKLAVIVFATRALGVAGWGVFSYALAFVSLFYIFSDIGINTFITRELSKQNADSYKYLSASLVLKTTLLILSIIASVILIPHLASIPLDIKIVLALALLNFSDSIREFALSVNRSLQKMEREAFIKILMNVIITGLGVTLLLIHANPLSLAIAYATGSIIASIVTVILLSAEMKHVQWKFPFSYIKTILDFAWPFIAVTIFMTVIANVDTIMLGQIKSAAEVGLYAASERIVQFLSVIPIFIGISTFPLMSKTEADPVASARIFEKTMTIILAVGFPIAIGGMLFSGKIMTMLFGPQYAAGGIVLAILMLSVLADFPNILISNIIFAKNLQKKFIIATAVGLLVNIAMNIFLIPRYGAIGAASATVVAQLFIMIINWQLLKRFLPFSIVDKLGIIVFSTAIMAGVLLLGNAIGLYFIITILIGTLTYSTLLYICKEPTLNEMRAIIKK
jgi:O-antigen/teichoic acid export membrane protein